MTPKRREPRMNVEIAQRLAAMRREKGYSQEELANRLGLSRQAVSKWERAESSPDTGNLIALADLYGVTLDELVRVDVDIADDVRFEEADKETTVEVTAEMITAAAESAAATAAVPEAGRTCTRAEGRAEGRRGAGSGRCATQSARYAAAATARPKDALCTAGSRRFANIRTPCTQPLGDISVSYRLRNHLFDHGLRFWLVASWLGDLSHHSHLLLDSACCRG